jgi:demethylmenaquinone methyltransferase/2-methoxy-6-polyprenyl-1,4-benzoquinol methylase
MPAAGTLEAGQVRAMFDRVAGVYDLLNSAMTAGLHHRWRERAVDIARVSPGSRVLDVATGTGDLALEVARRVAPGGEVVGSDFSEGMLSRAREKARREGVLRDGARGEEALREGTRRDEAGREGTRREGVNVRFEWGDALELPYPGDSFDAATVGFGVRNFADLGRGLAEMARVVAPGGRIMVLEFTTPTRPPLSWFYRLWFDRLVPLLGRAAGGVSALAAGLRGSAPDGTIAAAYTYLPESVKRFPGPRALAAEMERAGLEEIRWVLTAGGIVAIHSGTVASTPPGTPQREGA